MAKVTLKHNKEILEINSKQPLLEQLTKQGVILNSSCGGFGTCGDCLIKITKGYDHCSPPTYEEIKLLGNVFHLTFERLSCQLKVITECEIDISAHLLTVKKKTKIPQLAKTKIRKPSTNVATEVKKPEQPLKSEQPIEKQGGFKRPKRKF